MMELFNDVDICFSTRCAKGSTALRRLFKKHPEIECEWGETIETMVSNDIEKIEDMNNDGEGYVLRLYRDDDLFTIQILVRHLVEEEEELPQEALETTPFTYSYILSWRGSRKIVEKESYYFGELVDGSENLEDIYNSGVVYVGDWRIEFTPELDSKDCELLSRRVLVTEVRYEYV